MQHSDSVPCFLGHAKFGLCVSRVCCDCLSVCQSMYVCYLSLLSAPLVMSKSFQGTCSSQLYPPPSHPLPPKKRKNTDQSSERLLQYVACVCVGRLLSVCQGAKLFWMAPSHSVTTAKTDRGVVGQSGVGVLNELSRIQPASVSRGMNEWPDSLFTSSFLSDFPDLLPPATPPFNFVTLVSPRIPQLCIFSNPLPSPNLQLCPPLHLPLSTCLSLLLYAPFCPIFFICYDAVF